MLLQMLMWHLLSHFMRLCVPWKACVNWCVFYAFESVLVCSILLVSKYVVC